MNTLLGRISALSSRARFFLALFVVVFCGILVTIFMRTRQNPETAAMRAAALAAARAAHIAALTQDGDADGLKDWEEVLFRTDPLIADTDADGTPDGEEVKQGRDPLVQGPHDSVATSTPAMVDYEDVSPGSINMTGRVAQSLGQKLIAQRLMNPDKNIDPKAVSAEVARSIPAYDPVPPSLSIRDLTVERDETRAVVTQWQKEFERILQDTFGGRTELEPMIMIKAVRDENPDGLAALDPVIAAHDRGVTRMRELSVPAPFAQDQLTVLGDIMQLRDILQRFREAGQDPLAAVAAIRPYFDVTDAVFTATGKIHDKLVARGTL